MFDGIIASKSRIIRSSLVWSCYSVSSCFAASSHCQLLVLKNTRTFMPLLLHTTLMQMQMGMGYAVPFRTCHMELPTCDARDYGLLRSDWSSWHGNKTWRPSWPFNQIRLVGITVCDDTKHLNVQESCGEQKAILAPLALDMGDETHIA